jgi:pimeloyl-ACP methyl ester carboxylesterase
MPLLHTARGRLWVADHRQPDQPTYLLVHGAGGAHIDWGMPLRKLPSVAVDLSGHGRSDGAGHDSLMEHAADLVAVLDALDLPQAIVVGHSMGGAVALLMALHHPSRVRALGLVATGARLRVSPDLLHEVEHAPTQAADRLSGWLWGADVPDAVRQRGREQFLARSLVVTLRDYRASDGFDLRPHLPSIAVPARVLCGTADRMTPPKLSDELAAGLPDATLHRFEDAGHMLQIERAAEVAAVLARLTQA